MAPFAKIYSYPGNWRVHRALTVAAINGLDIEVVEDFKMGVTNKTPEFLAKFPLGKVPTMECADGFCLAESAAICKYLAETGPAADQLLGAASDPKTRARISEWSFFVENELVANMMTVLVIAVLKLAPFDEQLVKNRTERFQRALLRVEHALKGGDKYLVGQQLTLADIMVAGTLFPSLGVVFGEDMRNSAPNTMKYLGAIAQLPEFKSFGDLAVFKA